MPLPEFATWINPLLLALKELGGSARPREAVDRVASNQNVSDAVLDQTIQGGVSRFSNQVHWARYYLADADYIDRSQRGVWRLTEKGRLCGVLTEPEIRNLIDSVQVAMTQRAEGPAEIPRAAVPEIVEMGIAQPGILAPEQEDEDHRSRLLRVLKSLPPSGFERLCQRLLREAGFEQVTVTGKSGDGGIDGHGVLALNSFVSFRVLFQCKRYEGSVTVGEVRDFRGAMQGRADKGIILTTGNFTADARREAVRDGVPPIELVNGEKLVELFEHLELGLISRKAFDLDEGFFSEFRT